MLHATFSRFGLIILSSLSLFGFVTASFSCQPPHGADSAGLLHIKQEFFNALDKPLTSLTPIQRVAILRLYEKELDRIKQSLSRQEYLDEKFNVANRYWEERAHDDALEAYQRLADDEPDSLYSAKAYWMQGAIKCGNLQSPASSLKDLQKSVDILKELRITQPDNAEINRQFARSLSLFGDACYFAGRPDESIKQFEYLLSIPQIVAAADETELINANSSLARRLSESGELDRALRYYEAADDLARKSSRLSGEFKLAFAMESIIAQGKTLSEQDRLLQLDELWITGRKDKSLAVLRVGNELVLSTFFSEDKAIKKRLTGFADDLQTLSNELMADTSESVSPEDLSEIYSISQQTRLLQAEHYEQKGSIRNANREIETLKKLQRKIERRGANVKFSPQVPANLSKDFVDRILVLKDKFWPESKGRPELTKNQDSTEKARDWGKSVLEPTEADKKQQD